MAALKSDNEDSLHLDEAVDPKLGVWGIVKESVRITLKHRATILGVVVLFVLPLVAFTSFSNMRRLEDLYAVHQLRNRCAQMLVAAKHGDQQPTFTRDCLEQLKPLNILRKVYGWGWFLDLAATYVLAFLALAALVFAVVDAYDAERTHSTDGGLVKWLKRRFKRKLLVAAMRALGTYLLTVFVSYGVQYFFVLAVLLPALVLPWPWGARLCLLSFASVAFVVVLMYLVTGFYLAQTVSVVEPGTWGAGALSRSSELTKGHRWKAVALMLPYALLYWPILTVPHGLVKPSIGLAAYMVASQIALDPFVIIVPTVFYLKCRAYWSAVKHDIELGGQGYEHIDKLVKESEPL